MKKLSVLLLAALIAAVLSGCITINVNIPTIQPDVTATPCVTPVATPTAQNTPGNEEFYMEWEFPDGQPWEETIFRLDLDGDGTADEVKYTNKTEFDDCTYAVSVNDNEYLIYDCNLVKIAAARVLSGKEIQLLVCCYTFGDLPYIHILSYKNNSLSLVKKIYGYLNECRITSLTIGTYFNGIGTWYGTYTDTLSADAEKSVTYRFDYTFTDDDYRVLTAICNIGNIAQGTRLLPVQATVNGNNVIFDFVDENGTRYREEFYQPNGEDTCYKNNIPEEELFTNISYAG